MRKLRRYDWGPCQITRSLSNGFWQFAVQQLNHRYDESPVVASNTVEFGEDLERDLPPQLSLQFD